MKEKYANVAIFLSYILIGLSTIASVGGLYLDGLYRGTEFVISTWAGNDAVTLIIAIPLLIGSVVFVSKGSKRAKLIWIGMLNYMLYNYGFYLFGAAFNWFFFLYVLLFALSIWALIIVLLSLDVDDLATCFTTKTPVKLIAGFMAFVGVTLTTVYFLQWLDFVRSGKTPLLLEMTGHPTNLVFALDLSLVVPVLLVGAFLLSQSRPWGYVLAAMVNIKGSIYMLALSAATLSAFQAGTVSSIAEISLWLSIGGGLGIASFVLIRNFQT